MTVTHDTPGPPALTGIAPWVREILRCPATGGELVDGVAPDGAPRLESPAGALSYPVRDGVPVLLAHEAAPLRRSPSPDRGPAAGRVRSADTRRAL